MMKITNKNISNLIFVLISIAILLTLIIKDQQYLLVIWTIALVIITALYVNVNATYKILDIQNNAEKLKYFIEIQLNKVHANEEEHSIKKIHIEFTNTSNLIGYKSMFRIFQGDTIIEMINNSNATIQKEIGIFPRKATINQVIYLHKPILVARHDIKLRIEFKLTNPLKIENIFYYLVTFKLQDSGILGASISLFDFDNGIKNVDLKEFRKLSI